MSRLTDAFAGLLDLVKFLIGAVVVTSIAFWVFTLLAFLFFSI